MKIKVMNRAIFTGWSMLLMAIRSGAIGIAIVIRAGVFIAGKSEAGHKTAHVEMRHPQPIQDVSIAGAGEEGFRKSWEGK